MLEVGRQHCRSVWLRWLLPTLVLLALVSACAGGSSAPRSPHQTIADYAAALKRDDAKAAYALLSTEAQRRLPFARFERMLSDNPDEVRALAEALEQPEERMVVTATLQGGDGESLDLVYEEGAWRAHLSAIDLYSQATPTAALASFVRAFEAKRYDVLLRFVPESEQEGLTAAKLRDAWEGVQKEEMQELVDALKASLPTAKAERLANRATIAYGSQGTVELLEERGLWKIVSF